MRKPILVAVLATALVLAPAAAAAAGSVSREDVTLTVDTQFRESPSDATGTGLLSGCTQVSDLGQVSTRSGKFIGTKHVDCGDGWLVLAYQAAWNGAGTDGTWQVRSSGGSLSGLRGGGSLVGTLDCEVADDSEGCITDTFTGTVHLAPAG